MQTSRQTIVSSAAARRQAPAAASAAAEPKQPAAPAAAAVDAPQPLDAELLQHVGGAGLGFAPVNRW